MSTKVNQLALSPELRSWVDNCLVPILVREYQAELQRHQQEVLASEDDIVRESAVKSPATAEGIH